MSLEERYSKKYDCKTVEKIGEEGGMEIYKILVTKNNGELREFIEVEVPASLEAALEQFDEEEVLSLLQEKLVTKARNRKRSAMVSPEEAQKKLEKDKNRISNLIESLKAQGASEEEIKEQLGL